MGHGGNRDHSDVDRHAGYGWLAFCTLGMISTLTLYGIALEYATSGGRKLHELSFVFVTTTIYSITAYVARIIFEEQLTTISKYEMLSLSFTSIASTLTSVISLRYVIYPVQVLFKSCKPVPVLVLNTLQGRTYPVKKYVNVVIITTGVALFMGGGNSTSNSSGGDGATLFGATMLMISLIFDGITGSNEDKLMAVNNVEPFDLMYNIQFGKAVISFVVLLITNQLGDFIHTVGEGGLSLVILGFAGAFGQVFVFITISKFGALNCALIGLVRKMLSLVLSFVLYGHVLNTIQSIGLLLAIIAMVANFYDKGGKKKGNKEGSEGKEGIELGTKNVTADELPLMIDDSAVDIEANDVTSGNEVKQEVQVMVDVSSTSDGTAASTGTSSIKTTTVAPDLLDLSSLPSSTSV